jgi:RNA polymerase sigma-70 factor (ECF subfamily)
MPSSLRRPVIAPSPHSADAPAEASEASLIAFYLKKRASLVRFFTLRTSSPAEAEDIVQEIYLKIAAVDSASVGNAAAFLYRLGANILLDRARARRRRTARDGAYHDVHASGPPGYEPEADAPNPEAAVDARLRLKALLASVKELPERCRRVFVMHKIDGLSYAEVAAALGISRSAVEKHMMAALRKLAKHRT